MKATDRRVLSRAVGRAVPRLRDHRRMLVETPIGPILRGVYLEASSDPSRCYVWAFVQPLYAPASVVSFNMGVRLGGGSPTWTTGDAEALATTVATDGVAFFGNISGPDALAEWKFLQGVEDPYARRARALSLVAAKRWNEPASALDALSHDLRTGPGWLVDMGNQCIEILGALREDPLKAEKILGQSERETKAQLH